MADIQYVESQSPVVRVSISDIEGEKGPLAVNQRERWVRQRKIGIDMNYTERYTVLTTMEVKECQM